MGVVIALSYTKFNINLSKGLSVIIADFGAVKPGLQLKLLNLPVDEWNTND